MAHRPERDFTDAVCQPFLWEGKEHNGRTHGVLLIHGFSGSIAQLRPLAEGLHEQGFTVMGINLPGHATKMDDMATKTWQDWLDAAKEAFLRLKATCDDVSVAGLSMGGCLTLLLAEQMQPTAIAAIAAPMGTVSPLWLTCWAAPFMKTIWWRARKEASPLIDSRYDYSYPGFPTVCGPHLLRLIKLSRRNLHAVTCPVLVVQSHRDATITTDSAEVILQGISSERKGVLWLTDAPHVCTLSKDAPAIADAIAQHFRQAEKN